MKTKNKHIYLGILTILLAIVLVFVFSPVYNVFAAGPQMPRISTGSAASITETSTLLTGSADPNYAATVAWFEWGNASNGLTSETWRQNMGSGDSSLTYIIALDGLLPDTVYFYRAVAENSLGKVYSSTKIFKTKAVSTANKKTTSTNSCSAPVTRTLSATSVLNNSASLKASVHPKGYTTQIWFEYGATDSLGQTVGSQVLNSFLTETTVTQTLSGLKPGTKYFYKVFAQSECGRVSGAVLSFTTSGTANPTGSGSSSTANTVASASPSNSNDIALALRLIPTQSQPQPVSAKTDDEKTVLGASSYNESLNTENPGMSAVKNIPNETEQNQTSQSEASAPLGFFASGSNIFFIMILGLIAFSAFSFYQNNVQYRQLIKNI